MKSSKNEGKEMKIVRNKNKTCTCFIQVADRKIEECKAKEKENGKKVKKNYRK